jgi:SRSO17 transposase
MGRTVEAFLGAAAQRFRAYVEHLAHSLGHSDRREPLRDYLTGLVLPGERKSVEPMAGMCCNFENSDEGRCERNWAARSQAARSNSLSMN